MEKRPASCSMSFCARGCLGPPPPLENLPSLTSPWPRASTAPPRSSGLNPDPPQGPRWLRAIPSCPHLSYLSLKPSPAWSAPLQSPQVSRPQPCGLTTATAQPKSFFWGDNTRVLSGSLPLVPKDLLSTLAKEVLLDTSQLWPQPRGDLRGLSLCLDATSGSLLWPRFWVLPCSVLLDRPLSPGLPSRCPIEWRVLTAPPV